jgi:energy-coupling factor transporter ATP-binding protein EcfA2
MIKSFSILGLFGNIDVSIPIDKSGVCILIGENGMGKTTVLNILYHTLKANFSRLAQYDFKKIIIEFSNKEKAIIDHKDLKNFIIYEMKDNIPRNITHEIINSISQDDLMEILENIQSSKLDEKQLIYHPAIRNNSRIIRKYPPSIIAKVLISFAAENLGPSLIASREAIRKNQKGASILYFPTYRRIEEDLKNLGIPLEDEDESIRGPTEKLIQFGMDDVKIRFKNMQSDIQKLSSIGLSKITSEILSQLITGTPTIDEDKLKSMNLETIRIILARVGTALNERDKNKIEEIITNEDMRKKGNQYILYFIQKLTEIYEQQRALDEKIKKYIYVCNKYLKNSKKEIHYVESEVEFFITAANFSEKKPLVDFLSKLSSGEKQILSLFSKIYLSSSDDTFIVLFDEPELSLSIFWQEQLLPDIMKSEKCQNLIAVTHSPFIYDNELKNYAIGMNEYLKIGEKK